MEIRCFQQHQNIRYRSTVRYIHHRLLDIDQPSDIAPQTIKCRSTVIYIQHRLLDIDQPSDISTIDYQIQTNRQLLNHRILDIDQPPDISTIEYQIQINCQIIPPETNLYERTAFNLTNKICYPIRVQKLELASLSLQNLLINQEKCYCWAISSLYIYL